MEYLQAQAGESEEAAWKRLRPKLGYTGRQLDEVFLLQPSAVPATGGMAAPAPTLTTGGFSAPAFAPHEPNPMGPLGGGYPPAPSPPQSPSPSGGVPPTSPPPPQQPGGIFGGGNGASTRTTLSNPATSPLNLIGKLESADDAV
jgi:hypothetical protein